MSAIQRISDRMALADVVAFDRDDRPVVIVAATEGMIYPEIELASYEEIFGSIRKYIPFAILAFAEEMTIYRKRRDGRSNRSRRSRWGRSSAITHGEPRMTTSPHGSSPRRSATGSMTSRIAGSRRPRPFPR